MKNLEKVLGLVLIILLLILGKTMLKTEMLFFRLLVGIGLGYALARGYGGFAGSVNRAYNFGSTKLMRALMYLFFISSIITAALLFGKDPTTYGLWINPINLGLLLGGTLFGFGMSFSACCASGVLTDLSEGLPRAFITLVFFAIGVFLGLPLQSSLKWVTTSLFTTSTFPRGVFFPDLFKGDGLEGYLGAIILTGVLALIVVGLSYLYEKRRKEKGTYKQLPSEIKEDKVEILDTKEYKMFSKETYNRLFARPWKLNQAMVVIALLFALLMGVTGSGWGASTPYGMWFGKVLMIFGVSAESLASFTSKAPEFFTVPFFQHAVSVQNFGIIFGAVIYLLTSSTFKDTFLTGLKITPKEALLYAFGGILMGLGTRFANGCNVGALYTPIANFSLSGWIFLIVMIIGGIGGNIFAKKVGL